MVRMLAHPDALVCEGLSQITFQRPKNGTQGLILLR